MTDWGVPTTTMSRVDRPMGATGREGIPGCCGDRRKTSYDQFCPWLYLANYKASYFSL